ncbi:hypothetical protein AVEN_182242-1 [Araneus ventricosus]|uniref:Uncharacterized protein n=1 Tax=Araneus ventricosus TaxID=182803 RepID=A0A4Y2VI11_ARAVE|nr:hypothetical protein AVEN_182242-1 [Araneus ventricosus]
MEKEEYEEWMSIDENIPVAATLTYLEICQAVCEQGPAIKVDDSDSDEFVEENPPTNAEIIFTSFYEVSGGLVVRATAFYFYERGFDPRLGGVRSFVTILHRNRPRTRKDSNLMVGEKIRGGLVARSRLWGQRVLGSKPDSTEDPPCMWTRCKLNHTKVAENHLTRCAAESWKEAASSDDALVIMGPRFKIMRSVPKQPSCFF